MCFILVSGWKNQGQAFLLYNQLKKLAKMGVYYFLVEKAVFPKTFHDSLLTSFLGFTDLVWCGLH